MQLPEAVPGDVARGVRIDLDLEMRRRFRVLGLPPGCPAHVTHRGGLGGRAPGLGADRFALGAFACVRHYVSPVDASGPEPT